MNNISMTAVNAEKDAAEIKTNQMYSFVTDQASATNLL